MWVYEVTLSLYERPDQHGLIKTVTRKVKSKDMKSAKRDAIDQLYAEETECGQGTWNYPEVVSVRRLCFIKG